MLKVNYIPTNLNNSYHKALINLLSLSLTIYFDNPCNLKISLKNNSTIYSALNFEEMAKK